MSHVLSVVNFLLKGVITYLHLIMSGDVELNPGPLDQGKWNCMHMHVALLYMGDLLASTVAIACCVICVIRLI